MTSELKPCKPCPFCPDGGRVIYAVQDDMAFCATCCAAARREVWNRRAPSEAVGLLREVLTWLEDDQIGKWGYIENGQFYEDKFKQTDKIRRFLAAQEGT